MTDIVRRFHKGPRVVSAYTAREAVDLQALGYTEVAPEAPQPETPPAPPADTAATSDEPATAEDAVVDEPPLENTDHPDPASADPKH